MLDDIKKDAATRMGKCVDNFQGDLKKLRTGRAHPSLIENMKVDYYGTDTPLKQVANISVEDARTLVVSPWEKSMVQAIEKAIHKSDLGLNPASDGKILRIPIPSLTEERRKELSRHVHKLAEEGRNTVRGVRRDANDRLKKLLKDSMISEDDERKGLEQVQKMTDDHVKMIDELQKKKDAELLG